MSEYFPETKYLGGRVKVELNLPNYTTKQILKKQQVLINQDLPKKLIQLILNLMNISYILID